MKLGRRGEDLACIFLENHGYRVLERNVRYRVGEIDIVALKDGAFSFIEVKTRKSFSYGQPEVTFVQEKQRRFLRAVHMYIQEHDICDDVSVDFIAVSVSGYNARVTHYKQCELFDN